MAQVALLEEGRSPAEQCRCDAPASAVAVDPDPTCEGETVVLDAAFSRGCLTGRQYRWLDERGEVACDWSTDPTCEVVAGSSSFFVLTAACLEDTFCHDRAVVNVPAAPVPVPDAGPDLVVCPGETVVLDGSGSSPEGCADIEYRWSDETGCPARLRRRPDGGSDHPGGRTGHVDLHVGRAMRGPRLLRE